MSYIDGVRSLIPWLKQRQAISLGKVRYDDYNQDWKSLNDASEDAIP